MKHQTSEKDLITAEHELSLKVEFEIRLLLEQIDRLRESKWEKLLGIQKELRTLLASLIEKTSMSPKGARPDQTPLVNYWNARERIDKQLNEDAPVAAWRHFQVRNSGGPAGPGHG